MNVSVIICTHNPRREYLGRALEGLEAQTLPKDQWEFILIDNASQDRLADSRDLSWHPHGRHVREEELGLTPARLRGISEARGDLLVFVDDDNVLAPDFLERALGVAARYPHLGAFGAGILAPEFEVPPVAAVVPLLPRLALRSVSTPIWSNNHQDGTCSPYGAGMCVRRNVADQYQKIIRKLTKCVVLDRRGDQLSSNGDDLFSWAAVQLGLGFGIFPELQIKHLIPAGRVARAYMLRLVRESQFSESVLYYLLLDVRPRPMGLPLIARVLFSGIKDGYFAMQCRWASARGEARAAKFISKNGIAPTGKSSTARA